MSISDHQKSLTASQSKRKMNFHGALPDRAAVEAVRDVCEELPCAVRSFFAMSSGTGQSHRFSSRPLRVPSNGWFPSARHRERSLLLIALPFVSMVGFTRSTKHPNTITALFWKKNEERLDSHIPSHFPSRYSPEVQSSLYLSCGSDRALGEAPRIAHEHGPAKRYRRGRQLWGDSMRYHLPLLCSISHQPSLITSPFPISGM